jgi:HSP20 family protein
MSNDPDQVPINLMLGGDELVLHAPLPGAEPEDIQILFDDKSVTLHSTMRGMPGPDKKILVREWQVGEYHRSVELPHAVDTERVNVTYNNGVLTIAMPRGARTTPRQLRLMHLDRERGTYQGHSGQR